MKLEPFKTISRNTKGRSKKRFMHVFALDTEFLPFGIGPEHFFSIPILLLAVEIRYAVPYFNSSLQER